MGWVSINALMVVSIKFGNIIFGNIISYSDIRSSRFGTDLFRMAE